MRKIAAVLLLVISGGHALFAQQAAYPRKDLDALCAPYMAGRGYVNHGDRKAAQYLEKNFRQAGLLPLAGKKYFQPFTFGVNTFPGKVEVSFDKHPALVPGADYLVKANSPSVKGTYPLRWISREDIETERSFAALLGSDWTGMVAGIDTMSFDDKETDKRYQQLLKNAMKARALVVKSKRNLLWTVARTQGDVAVIEVMPAAVPAASGFITLNIRAVYEKAHATQNVLAYIPGTQYPDSFIVYTAHYDHLGMMGSKTMFPGANDNASGTSMLLEMARYYAAHPQPYSIAFMAFAGEEAGLVGSKYYTENPVFPLKNICFLLNLDLVGTGDGGITVVNGSVFPEYFEQLVNINKEKNYLTTVQVRGKAANSDHYWFTENGVKAFFIYQMGDYGHYHDIGDQPGILPCTRFAETMELLKDFATELQQSR